MEAITKSAAMVNPSKKDEDKFREAIAIVDKINDLRTDALTIIYNIDDGVLRRNAVMLMGLPDETARKR
jgi:hypothetical protein